MTDKNYEGTILLKCANCGGHLETDEKNAVAKCPYCGATELLVESDEAVIERIRNKAFQDVNNEKIQADREIEQTKLQLRTQAETAKKLGKSRKSPLTAIIALLTIASLFSAADVFRSKYYISFILMCCQTLLFFAAWLMRMRLIKGAKFHLHSIFAWIALLLIIPFFMFIDVKYQYRSYDRYIWQPDNLSVMIPKPTSDYGEIEWDMVDKFILQVGEIQEQDYHNYVEDCMEKGFSLKTEKNSRTIEGNTYHTFSAFNESGAELTVAFFSHLEEMEITIEGYPEFYEFIWPEQGLAILLPESVSKTGIINRESEDSFRVTVAKTPFTEYSSYIQDCMDSGFSENIFEGEDFFHAQNSDGMVLSVQYRISDVMEISLRTP